MRYPTTVLRVGRVTDRRIVPRDEPGASESRIVPSVGAIGDRLMPERLARKLHFMIIRRDDPSVARVPFTRQLTIDGDTLGDCGRDC